MDMMPHLNQAWQDRVLEELCNAYYNNNDLINLNLHAAIHEQESVHATYSKERADHLYCVADVIEIVQALSGEIEEQFGGRLARDKRRGDLEGFQTSL